MIRPSFQNFLLTCCLISCPYAAYAATYGDLKLDTTLKSQMTVDQDADLETAGSGSEDSEILEARIRATLNLMENITVSSEIRAVKNFGDGGSTDPDTGEATGIDDFIELRQYWVEKRQLFGLIPLSLKAGRQSFSEPSGLWWSRDFDAARASYNTTLFNGFIAAGQNMVSYKTSDNDFNNDDEDLFRLFGESSWQWGYGHFLEGRFAWQKDHSGGKPIGSLFDENDRDDTDADLLWAGFRARGQADGFDPSRKANYRLDVMGLYGEEDIQGSAAAPGPFRSVTGYDNRDVHGWAFDTNLTLPLPLIGEPSVILGYGFGSGDDNTADGSSGAFRQTGLDSNSNKPGFSSGGMHQYGTVLRPDLSNLHILTAGLTLPLFSASDISTVYHYYRLDEPASSLLTSGIDAPLNNSDKDLGQGVDVMLNINLSQELGLGSLTAGKINMRATLGAFRAGEAYGTAEGEVASRGFLEFQVKF